MEDEALEQTLHIARSVDVFQVPPRAPGSQGYYSGEWLVSSKIFSGRLRVVSQGELCLVKLEDASSGELFAVCPIPYGKRTACVEPVVDSSRYFVIRVEDPATKRHAFLGMGFTERGDAFDFNEALQRHEKFLERERAAAAAGGQLGSSGSAGAGGAQRSAGAAAASKEVASLYAHSGDLALKDGQTIHVNIKAGSAHGSASGSAHGGSAAAAGGTGGSTGSNSGGSSHGGGGFFARAAAAGAPMIAAVPAAGGSGFKLAPPPQDLLSGGPTLPTSPPTGQPAFSPQQAPAYQAQVPQQAPGAAFDPFSDLATPAAPVAVPQWPGQAVPPAAAAQQQPSQAPEGWATFD